MDVYETIANRRSVRAYQDRPVEDDKLQRILAAGCSAPTARNRQEFKIVVVRDAKIRSELAEAAGQAFIARAPVVLAVVGLTPQAAMHCQIPTDPVDCAIVIDHMTLAATAEGLGACWIGHFDQAACCRILGVPKTARIIELLPMGYAADAAGPKSRKPQAKLVCHDRFA